MNAEPERKRLRKIIKAYEAMRRPRRLWKTVKPNIGLILYRRACTPRPTRSAVARWCRLSSREARPHERRLSDCHPGNHNPRRVSEGALDPGRHPGCGQKLPAGRTPWLAAQL